MKRPLGLAKAKASKAGGGSPTKKQKVTENDEDEKPQSLSEDWSDLQQLFARAAATFLKDQPNALPLLRGVIHECDRISRNTSREDRLALQAEESSLAKPTDSHNSFASLFADALLHLGIVLGSDPDLAVEGEPDSARSYFDAALDILKKDYSNQSASPQDTRLHYTWANVLSLLADIDVSSEDTENVSKFLDGALEHYALAHSSAASFEVLSISESSVAPEQGEEPLVRLPQLTKARIHATFATQLFNVCEQMSALERDIYTTQATQAALKADATAVSPHEDDAIFDAALIRGRIHMARIHELLPEGFEDDEKIATKPIAEGARDSLRQAIADFDKANTVLTRGFAAATNGTVLEAELKGLLGEALLYLANLTTDQAEKEKLLARAEEAGVGFSDDDGDEDDDMED